MLNIHVWHFAIAENLNLLKEKFIGDFYQNEMVQ